jgi:hypothetical protein
VGYVMAVIHGTYSTALTHTPPSSMLHLFL